MIRSFKQRIHRILKKRGYQIVGNGYLKSHFFELLLYELLEKNKRLSFVQIGANDGVTFDPIFEFVKANPQNVTGIVIEPLGEYFEQLSGNYRKYPGIIPLNMAIHNSEKEMLIYRISPDRLADYPDWGRGVPSFKKEKLISSDNIRAEDITSEKVACVSLSQLLTERQLDGIDVLLVDAEGYDYEIVRNLDFDRFQPSIIQFEHGLPNGIMTEKELAELRGILHGHGYEIWASDWDIIAYRSDFLAAA